MDHLIDLMFGNPEVFQMCQVVMAGGMHRGIQGFMLTGDVVDEDQNNAFTIIIYRFFGIDAHPARSAIFKR